MCGFVVPRPPRSIWGEASLAVVAITSGMMQASAERCGARLPGARPGRRLVGTLKRSRTQESIPGRWLRPAG